MGGAKSPRLDRSRADWLLRQVRSCCQLLCSLWVFTDGWNAYACGIRRVFRKQVKGTDGHGRACLQACIGVVITRIGKKRGVEITRKPVEANAGASAGTAFRFSGRERTQYRLYRALKCDHATATRQLDAHVLARSPAPESGMWLLGGTSNYCWPHHKLSRRAAKAQGRRGEVLLLKALTSRLPDHYWSTQGYMSYCKLLHIGLRRNDVDDPQSRQSYPKGRSPRRTNHQALGPCFDFAKEFYVQPPISGALPLDNLTLYGIGLE